MNSCKKCGKPIGTNDQFCQFCGAQIPSKEKAQKSIVSHIKNLFSGRIGRKNWFFGFMGIMVVFLATSGIIFLISKLLATILPDSVSIITGWTGGLLILALFAINFILLISMHTRRFHDIGKSAWWLLLFLMPLVNLLALLYLLIKKGQTASNQYGNEPLKKIALTFIILNRQP